MRTRTAPRWWEITYLFAHTTTRHRKGTQSPKHTRGRGQVLLSDRFSAEGSSPKGTCLQHTSRLSARALPPRQGHLRLPFCLYLHGSGSDRHLNKSLPLLQGPGSPHKKNAGNQQAAEGLIRESARCTRYLGNEGAGWHTAISVVRENSPTLPVNKVHKSTNQSQGQVTGDEAGPAPRVFLIIRGSEMGVFQVPFSY